MPRPTARRERVRRELDHHMTTPLALVRTDDELLERNARGFPSRVDAGGDGKHFHVAREPAVLGLQSIATVPSS